MSFKRFPPILDVPGVADLLGLSIEEVRRLSGEGWLPSTMVNDRRFFRRDEVLEWLREQRVTPDDSPEPPEEPTSSS
jgi:hypothetical protein